MTTDETFWNRTAAKYAKDPVADVAGYERTLVRVAGLLKPSDRVVEIGCGTGTTALRLASGVAEYRATDLAPAMIEIARGKLAADPVPGLTFAVATVETLAADPGEVGSWDAVVGFNWLHLVPDLPGALRAARRLVKPGGLFITKTTCLTEMNPLIPPAVHVMRWLGKAPPSVGVFSAADLERAMVAAGFTIVAVERHGSKRKDPRVFIVAR